MTTIELPMRTRSESNAHEHWRARQKRAASQRSAVLFALRVGATRPALPCVVTLTRVSPRLLDASNVYAALKHCQDGVADWLGIDDRDPRVHYICQQEQGPAKYHAVRIDIAPGAVARTVVEAAP